MSPEIARLVEASRQGRLEERGQVDSFTAAIAKREGHQ